MKRAHGKPSFFSNPLSRPILRLSPPQRTRQARPAGGIRSSGVIDMLRYISGDGMAITVIAPFMGAVGEILAFPDRDFVLDPVDDIPVGSICFAAMGGSGDHHNGRFTNSYFPHPVLGDGYVQVPFLFCFLQDVS